ncbi:hypothetical protein CTR2_R50900 [Comamonas thiooxydans]|nr:hypothetical protein [Comamonas thiooxydans]BDR11752.1 hypothetical protein CTR2_R50900 [Comamonas thiooxydans]
MLDILVEQFRSATFEMPSVASTCPRCLLVPIVNSEVRMLSSGLRCSC